MKKKIILGIGIPLLILVVLVITAIIIYFVSLKPVSDNKDLKEFKIVEGTSSKEIVKNLKEKGYIKNELVTLIYIKLNNINIQAGTYEIAEDMGVKEIFQLFNEGLTIESKGITVTFIEGKRIEDYIPIITENFGYSEEEINELLHNEEYLNELIDGFWFLTDEILAKDIYIPLEGYLYPDTYTFNVDASLEEILATMLNNFDRKVSPYKEEIENSNLTMHEILSLASDVEIEGNTKEDRKLIAGVFLNRLDLNMPLGSDVTTYYAVSKDLGESLYYKDLNTENAYNTRGPNMNGRINVGPICNPSIISIEAVISPEDTDYLYFYADYMGDGKVYYSKTYEEHMQTVARFES